MDPTFIILGVVLLVLLYILFVYLTTDNELLQEYVHLDDNLSPIEDLEKPESTRYAYGFWIYVNTWDSSQTKSIIKVQDNMEIYLDRTTASLMVDIKAGPSADLTESIQISNNFPLQKWVHVIVSFDNEFVDCYMDGKLVRSARIYKDDGGVFKKPSVPPANSKIEFQQGSFDAYMSKLKRWTYPINPQKAYDEYMQGNGQGNFAGIPTYGLDLKVLKDNELYKEVNIF
tara:strand:+ start:4331 stop:5017 length:687 start_codon:yes stop_codon:yes gene_type:complete